MQRLRIKVSRQPPRARNRFEGLIGTLDMNLEVCSKVRGDSFNSYLYVGSGRPSLRLDEESLKLLLKGKMDMAVKNLRIDFEHLGFVEVSETPTIPGSTLKGNVRSRIELSFRAKDGNVRSCFIRASLPRPKPSVGEYGWRHYEVWGDILFENRGAPCDYSKGGGVCLVCDLFGTAGLKGLIDFSDFKGEAIALKPMNLPYGLKILAAPPGSIFKGRINFFSLRSHELGLLLLGMRLSKSRKGKPVLLGRLKYRSAVNGFLFGRVSYVANSLKLNELSEGFNEVKAGASVEGDKLDFLIEKLTDEARRKFGDELMVTDEVAKLASLK